MSMRTWRPALAVAVLTFCAAEAAAQPMAGARVSTQPAPAPADNKSETWAFAASAYGYFVPEADDYVQPTFTADRGRLHLEARYNYEDMKTGSAWVGVTFGGGQSLTWEVTPMVGGVFGNTDGVAPGYRLSLGWRKLALDSEGEYLIDVADTSVSFFYNWSELTLAPTEWLRFGIVGQRTHAYQSDRDIQRGLLVGFTYNRLDVAGYVFNPDDSKPIAVVSVRVAF
jgi:hypothetical protein